jgi:hypothetical protein
VGVVVVVVGPAAGDRDVVVVAPGDLFQLKCRIFGV